MKAFEIISHEGGYNESRIVAYENVQELEKYENVENCEIEEICNVINGCSGADMPYFLEGDDKSTSGDYILEDGSVIGDETHSGQGMSQGNIDIEKTNKINLENGDCEFSDWTFDLWIGSFWNGSNHKVIVIEKL